jgi:ABC-type polysaccharide/polyol phosphate transport system ATPase subunit
MSFDPRLPVISLKNVSKKYPIYDRPSQKFWELLSFKHLQLHREFWALREIDLEVERGSTLGIIGPNGSGKSTLLQIVARILRQTRGECQVKGNVAALLELGTGFNPEFTGRQNVFLSGAINGLSKSEIAERFEDIVEFAEIGEFIEQPVKSYSSGMFVRLAFAVAIHVDPDILLVDEALAVGDLIFQHRCINRIRRMRREGKTILFVTHDLQALTQFCDRAILLDQGRKLEDSTPEIVIQKYQALIFERERRRSGAGDDWIELAEDDSLSLVETIPYIHNRYGEGGAEILGIILLTQNGRVVNEVKAGENLKLLVSVHFKADIDYPIVGVTIRDRMGQEITATNTSYEGLNLPPAKAGDRLTAGFSLSIPELRPGSYSISPAVASGNIWEHQVEDWIDNAYIFNLADCGLVYGLMKWSFEAAYRRFDKNSE